MSLSVASAASLSTLQGDSLSPALGSSALSYSGLSSSSLSTTALRLPGRRLGNGLVVSAAKETDLLTGIVFQPFEEMKKEELAIPIAPQLSLARQFYEDECEAAINEQIKWGFLPFIFI